MSRARLHRPGNLIDKRWLGHSCWPAGDVYSRGQTLGQHWQQLRQRYGAFEYRSGYFIVSPPSKSAAVFERLRSHVPASIGGCAVTAVRDLGTGVDTAQPGEPWAGVGGGLGHYALPCAPMLCARASALLAHLDPPLQMAARCCRGRRET